LLSHLERESSGKIRLEAGFNGEDARSTQNHVRSVCPYCGVGCGIVMRVENGRVTKVVGDKHHPANFGRLCSKGFSCAEPLTAPDRLATAFARNSRTVKPQALPMDDAIAQTAAQLQKIIAEHGPDSVALYVSGQLSMEAQYLSSKLAKGFIRTNNIDSNSRLCMASAASGYKLSLGADGPPGSYQDIDRLDCALVIGSNMAECHPILFLRLMDRQKRGAKVIVVDPRRTPTADKADLFLQIKPGTDLALLNGLLHLLEKAGHVDEKFIAQNTEGWEELRALLKDYPPEHVAHLTKLREEDIRTAAKWIGESPEFTSFWTMGLNQSTHGTWQTNAICNLHLATGKICRPGSGPFSLTGQPNAMGGREVGYLSHTLPGQRAILDAEDRAAVEKIWGVPAGTIQPKPGLAAVEMFQKIEAGEVKAVWIIGTNPIASLPNRARVIAALQRAELVIVQDAFHPTETTRYADILLPGALWAEAEGTMVNSERNVTLMPRAVAPPGEARPDWQIIAQVAQRLGFGKYFDYASASEVFDEIRRTWNPQSGYDLRGMDFTSLREQSRQWPMAPGAERGEPIRYLSKTVDDGSSKMEGRAPHPGPLPIGSADSADAEREKCSQLLSKSTAESSLVAFGQAKDGQRLSPLPAGEGQGERGSIRFPTKSGKAQLFARPFLPPAEAPDAEFPFILTNGRVEHQWHTLTKTGKVAQLNKLNPGAFVQIHPVDAEQLGVHQGMLVKVASRRGFAIYPAQVTTRVRPGECFAPIHWNDQFGENLCVNATTTEARDEISLQPEFKFSAVTLVKVAPGAPDQFTAEQRHYLLRCIAQVQPRGQAVPVEAPFSLAQREFISKLLADGRNG
jgi:sulfite reductase (NADPH) flavoprotein alpha-component